MIMIRRYSEVITLPTFEERFEYLKLSGTVAETTFGSLRYLNQQFYNSEEWKRIRREVIIRDSGLDLAHEDYPISTAIVIHHINPISAQDILERHPSVTSLENLIVTSDRTHRAIHYGSFEIVQEPYVPRSPNDTIPWKK